MTPRRKKRLLLGLVIVPLATVLGLEIGARVIDRLRGRPFDAERSRDALEKVCQMLERRPFGAEPLDPTKPDDLLLQPYTGWEYASTQEYLANEAAWYQTPRSDTAYDVCIVGGSVAGLFAKFGRERLFEVIRKDPRFQGRELRLHNFGTGGFKQPQQVMCLAYHLALGLKPDAVIDIDGFNEAALGWQNARAGSHPLYPSLSHWATAAKGTGQDWDLAERIYLVRVSQDRALALGQWFLRSGVWKSCFLEHAVSLRFERVRRAYASAHQELLNSLAERSKNVEVRGPKFEGDDDSIARIIVASWVESSDNLHDLCKSRGIAYLHVLQPTLHDEGSKPLTQKEIDTSIIHKEWLEGVQKVYPLLREAAPRLRERGVPFLDASGVFRDHPEDLYYDLCHFEKRGNEILAEAIAAEFLRLLGS